MFWYLIVMNASIKKNRFTLRLRACSKVSRAGQGASTFFDFSREKKCIRDELIVQTFHMCFTDANRKTKRISVLSVVISDSAYKILRLQYQGP